MNTKSDNNLGQVLKSLREKLNKSHKEVEKLIEDLYPIKDYHITGGYLSLLENGKATKPSIFKLKSLAKVYGVRHGKLMQLAGYVDEDPSAGPQEWSKETLRDYYLESLLPPQSVYTLSESERRTLEQALLEALRLMQDRKEDLKKPNDWLRLVFRNLHFDMVTRSKNVQLLSEKRKLTLDKLIEEYVNAYSSEIGEEK
jgi:transcriptional regulator with XRE-family HTH domain